MPGPSYFNTCKSYRISCMPRDEVPRRNGAVRENIPTSPMLVEYTTFMRGVDVADQLRASYSSQIWSHKWWHRIFMALLDITEVNIYIMYLDRCKQVRNPKKTPMTHLQFNNALCDALLAGWMRRNERSHEPSNQHPWIHMPSHSTKKRLCVVCGTRKPHTYCYKCGTKFMCWKEECYQQFHEALLQE
jgi:hypothetical protein